MGSGNELAWKMLVSREVILKRHLELSSQRFSASSSVCMVGFPELWLPLKLMCVMRESLSHLNSHDAEYGPRITIWSFLVMGFNKLGV